jgi:hypothetical protein
MLAATVGIAAPAAAGRVLMSRPVQSYPGNQALGRAGGNRAVDGLTAAYHESVPSRISPAAGKVPQGLDHDGDRADQ